MRDLIVTGTVAAIGDEIGNEIEHFFLPLSERHKAIVGEERGKIKGAGNYPLTVGKQ